MNNKKYQIFISSTYADLRDERQAAVEAILKAGHIPAGMELFAAGDESQMGTIKRWIEASDIYMLILGGRYGSMEPTTSLSYIELEYDYAVSLEKPIFAVVIKEEALDRKVKEMGKDVIETDHPQEYKSFRQKVLSKTSSFFEDHKDIKLAVHESIPDIQDRYDLTGWVSASEIQDTKSLLSEISRLSDGNAILTQENEDLKKRLEQLPKKTNKSEDYEELIDILRNIEIESILFDKSRKSPQRFSLLEVFYSVSDRLVTGITNQVGMANFDKLLYFNICPKLQIHGLAINERIPGVVYRRFSLTKEGLNLLSYIEKTNIFKDSSKPKKSSKPKET